MLTVYKYPLPVDDNFTVLLPAGAKPLTVQVQHGIPCLWALVAPGAKPVAHEFFMRGTGHEIDPDTGMVYLATFQLQGGSLVFHVFYRETP